ncbi:MAG: alpha/beta fold hydrolase, partial [Rhodospirillales bacterium]|nr:alpha/beta fold hydrolase [Rhodospirillales bacterium]
MVALATVFLGVAGRPACADNMGADEALGIAMEGYAYPHPVRFHPVTHTGEDLRMAYMDVTPIGQENGRAVVLMHGANFFGAYWARTINALSAAGFRVIVPDQIGFGKSSKPDLAYGFHWLAANTKALLEALGVEKAVIVG